MIFKRYHSPFLFLDSLIEDRQFSAGISQLTTITDDEQLWELYLHTQAIGAAVSPQYIKQKSFNDWKTELQTQSRTKNMDKVDVEATVKKSNSMLLNFKPKGVKK